MVATGAQLEFSSVIWNIVWVGSGGVAALGALVLFHDGVVLVVGGDVQLDVGLVGAGQLHGLLGHVGGLDLGVVVAAVLQLQPHLDLALQGAVLGVHPLGGGLPAHGLLLHYGAVGGEVGAAQLHLVDELSVLEGGVLGNGNDSSVLEVHHALPLEALGEGQLQVVGDVGGVLHVGLGAVLELRGQDVPGEWKWSSLSDLELGGLGALVGAALALALDLELVAVHGALHAHLEAHELLDDVLGGGHFFYRYPQGSS